MERGGRDMWLFIFITRLMSVVLFLCCLLTRGGWPVSRHVRKGFCLQAAGSFLLGGEAQKSKRGFLVESKHRSRLTQEGDAMEDPKRTKGDAFLDT